jgi:hypothetical protein
MAEATMLVATKIGAVHLGRDAYVYVRQSCGVPKLITIGVTCGAAHGTEPRPGDLPSR